MGHTKDFFVYQIILFTPVVEHEFINDCMTYLYTITLNILIF